MDPKRRNQLIEIAAIGAPLTILGFTRVFMSPVAASASTQGQAAAQVVPVATSTPAPTPEQKKAAAWIASVQIGPSLVSPLDHPKILAPAPEPSEYGPPAPAPEPPSVFVANPLEGLSLSATLKTREVGGVASINGKIYKVGDQVRPGCRLLSVDVSANSVEISKPDGSTVRLGRPK